MAGKARIRVDWSNFWGALWFMAFGIGFGGFGGWQLVTTYQFMGPAVELQAQLTEQSESCDDDGCTWWPTFTFKNPEGVQEVKRTQFGSSAYGWTEGTEKTILYNPAYSYIRMPGGDNLWLLGGGFFALGGLVFVLSFYILGKLTFSRVVNEE